MCSFFWFLLHWYLEDGQTYGYSVPNIRCVLLIDTNPFYSKHLPIQQTFTKTLRPFVSKGAVTTGFKKSFVIHITN